MRARLGPSQRVVLLCLMDGTARPARQIDEDMLLTPGRAARALRGLYGRGLAQPQYTGVPVTEWSLTAAGRALAEEVHGIDGDDAADVLCRHGRFLDGPCRDCRTDPHRCDACGATVTGGTRGPHRRDHTDRGQPAPTFTVVLP